MPYRHGGRVTERRPEIMRLQILPRSARLAWLIDHAAGTLFALATVALVTALIALARLTYDFEHITILYLIPVLVAALRWGIVPAIVAALAGVAAPAFFFYAPRCSICAASRQNRSRPQRSIGARFRGSAPW
jgi:K+-sensing histidine kinase KdpD